MSEPLEPHRTVPAPPDPNASASSSADETAPLGSGRPKFGPPTAPGEVGTLGPYRVVKQLGAGGMGAVYLAIDTRLDRKLALKVMLPEFAADRDAKERFVREARAAAKITHDNVVVVYDADERNGVPYIAMQFLQGYPLDQYLKQKGAPALAHVIRIARETALGLAAAHELGLVHRDIKPANLWLEVPNGRVKVLDFGLAKPVGTDAELTKSGAVVGTPAYMSPEQARGLKVDHRTDLFSLGAVLYRLCTGKPPFTGPNVMAVLMTLGTEEPTPVRELNPSVPEPLAQLIHQLLAKKPEARPQTATEVARRLRVIAEQLFAPPPKVIAPDGSVPIAAAVDLSVSQPVVVNPLPVQPIVVPMQVSAQPESAFAHLGDDDADDATEAEPSARPKRSGGQGVLLAAGAAVLLACAAVAVVVSQMGKKPKPVAVEPPAGPAEPAPREIKLPPVSKPGVDPPKPPVPDTPPARRPPKPWIPPAPVPVGASPLDKLDRAAIPKEDLLDWQPPQLVAVAGTHSPRTWRGLIGGEHRREFAVSPDGSLVAAVGWVSPVQVWDVKARTLRAELPGGIEEAAALAFSPDGRFLTTYYSHPARRYVRWDLNDPSRPATDWLNGLPADKPVGLWFTPDGTRAAVQTHTEVVVWNLSVKPPKELSRTPTGVWSYDVGVSRDLTRVAHYNAAAKGVVVYDITPTGAKERWRIDADSARMALSPDGTKLVTGWNPNGHPLRMWDLTADPPTAVEFAPRTAHWGWRMAFSPDGKRLVTQDVECSLRLWDVTGKTPQPVWSAPFPVYGHDVTRATRVTFAGENGSTLVAVTGWGLIHFIDISGAEPKALNPVERSEPIGPELRIDGASGRVALGRAADDRLLFWDFARAKPAPTDRVLPRSLIAHTPDFGKMAAWEVGVGTNLLVDGDPVGRVTPPSSVGAISADGTRYWAQTAWDGPGNKQTAIGWDLSGKEPRQVAQVELPAGGHPTWWYRLVRNDTVLAVLSGGTLMFVDVTAAEPKLLSTLPAWADPAARVFPDGERVIKRQDNAPQLWQLSDKGWAKTWDGPPDVAIQYAAHPSGKWFALYSQGELTVRRADDPVVPVRTVLCKAAPMKLEFAPDGRHLFVVNGFNTVYVLRLADLPTEPDRAVAEWALAVGGKVTIKDAVGARIVSAGADLPREPFAVTVLHLTGTGVRVTDADLARVAELTELSNLQLGTTAVTDDGLKHLAGLKQLRVLNLHATKVNGTGLTHLGKLTALAELGLQGTGATDATLTHFPSLGGLTVVDLRVTPVTATGVEKLQKLLPKCKIEWSEPKK